MEKSHFAYRSFFLKVDKFSYPENELWYLLLLQIRFGNGLLPFCHITRYSNKDTTKIYYKYEYLLCAKRGSMKFWKMKLEWNWKNLILIKFLEAIENYQFQIKNWLIFIFLFVGVWIFRHSFQFVSEEKQINYSTKRYFYFFLIYIRNIYFILCNLFWY